MSHSLSNQLVNRKKKLSLGKADTYLMSEMSLKHSWTLQIKILSKDILAYAIYLAETYINGIRSKTVPRQQESFYVQTQELHHPKVLRHLTLIWTGEGKKGKRRKGKEKKYKLVFEMCMEDRLGKEWVTIERSKQTSFIIEYHLHLK